VCLVANGVHNRPIAHQQEPSGMADTPSFTKLVPGFEFLQGLVKNAGAALPGIGQWIAPTLDPAELEKRINELRTVQFWLEQNARMLGATIQALEVQRMTLSTLQTMNVHVGDLRESLKIRVPEPEAPPAPAASWASPGGKRAEPPSEARGKEAASAQTPPAVDPMQWWGAVTRQFTELATNAMKEGAADAARHFTGTGAGAKAAEAPRPASKKEAAPAPPAPAASKAKSAGAPRTRSAPRKRAT
jgi:hypothetical protein